MKFLEAKFDLTKVRANGDHFDEIKVLPFKNSAKHLKKFLIFHLQKCR